MWFYNTVMCPKDADRMANSVDIDQTVRMVKIITVYYYGYYLKQHKLKVSQVQPPVIIFKGLSKALKGILEHRIKKTNHSNI